MKTELVVWYPGEISKFMELVISDYTFKPDKITWDSSHIGNDFSFSDYILKSDSDIMIFHQFYTILQRDDLNKMVNQLKNADNDVFMVSLYPRTLDKINCHVTKLGENYTHGDGTGVFRVKLYKDILILAKTFDNLNPEEAFVKAILELGYKTEFAPYAREWYIPGHEMISKTIMEYFIKNF